MGNGADKMTDDFCLSDEILCSCGQYMRDLSNNTSIHSPTYIHVVKVKEFIKILKEAIKTEWEYNQFKDKGTGVLNIQLLIDKLAGDKLK